MSDYNLILQNEQDTYKLAKILAECSLYGNNKLIIYLIGNLGAGKTTFTQYFFRAIAQANNSIIDKIKSPTYTLIEHYSINTKKLDLYHFDLYRLSDPEEFYYLGVDEIFTRLSDVIMLIEWPQKGEDFLPPADIVLNLQPLLQSEESRSVQIDINNTQNVKNNFNNELFTKSLPKFNFK